MLKQSLLASITIVFLSGCSLGINHIGEPKQYNPKGVMVDEYSIDDYGIGVHVRAEYSEFQVWRSSASGFRGCTNILNTIAQKHAIEKGQRVTRINWQDMKLNGYLDHGRDMLTGVMNVNCEYYFDYVVKS
ncbi:hypothetical protein EK599_10155 [Vibrio sp. T187]|uniref:hypothetical protein n=1 Tax=Vibrio TaxID=662 RepID=UPI0010C9E493|nr:MULTISPECIES: hypothetical protein [Vibrio]MBW3696061.1 hypothetical protein [Vibrio sp. T187]